MSNTIVEAKNVSPKLSGGIHKVIDEYIKASGKFQENIEGEITT